MNNWTRRALYLVLFSVFLAFGATALGYRAMWVRYDSALQQLESRSERLDGVVNAGPDIGKSLDTVRSSVTPMLHPAGENAPNDVQQRLRELISASDVTLVSSQVALEAGAEGKLPRVRLTATITGEWVKLLRFMETLQVRRPPFWVRTASISREGANVPGAVQTARVVIQLEAPLAPPEGSKP